MSNIQTATRAQEIMVTLSDDDKAILKKHLSGKGGKSRRKSEAELLEKHPHVVPGTLAYDPVARKQYVTIKCEVTGELREHVFTSDLHQVKPTIEAAKVAQKAKKEATQARIKDLLEKFPELAKK